MRPEVSQAPGEPALTGAWGLGSLFGLFPREHTGHGAEWSGTLVQALAV